MPFYLSNYPRIEKHVWNRQNCTLGVLSNIIFHESGELCIKSLKKFLSFDPESAIIAKAYHNFYITVFITVLFTVVTNWKYDQCPTVGLAKWFMVNLFDGNYITIKF